MEKNQKKEEFLQEILKTQKKHKMKLEVAMNFPVYKILPDEVKLAVSILKKHGAVYVIEVHDDN